MVILLPLHSLQCKQSCTSNRCLCDFWSVVYEIISRSKPATFRRRYRSLVAAGHQSGRPTPSDRHVAIISYSPHQTEDRAAPSILCFDIASHRCQFASLPILSATRCLSWAFLIHSSSCSNVARFPNCAASVEYYARTQKSTRSQLYDIPIISRANNHSRLFT